MTTQALYTFEAVNVTLAGSAVTNVADQSVNGFNLVAVGAPQYEPISWNGFPAVTFDGVDDALRQTTGLANAMIGGIDKANITYVAFQRISFDASGDIVWGVGDNANANPFYRLFYTGTTWGWRKRDAATGAGGGIGPDGPLANNNPHVIKLKNNGTTGDFYIDRVLFSSASVDVGDMGTMDTFALACLPRTTDASFGLVRIWGFSSHDSLTASEEGALDDFYDQYMPRGLPGGGDFGRRRVAINTF